jgi:hypothetical protein
MKEGETMSVKQSTYARLLRAGDQYVEYGDLTYRIFTAVEDAVVVRDHVEAQEVDWDAAIASLKRLLRRQYAKGAMDGPEVDHERIEGQDSAL